MNEIVVLFDGYSKDNPNDRNSMLANCSCTLIKNDSHCIIVDTMTPWDGKQLIEKLQTLNVTPDQVTLVISTHCHSDHCGNNNLFLNATKHIVGQCVSYKNIYYQFDFNQKSLEICDNVKIIGTPGHTMSCISVIVTDTNVGKTVGIVGDLFEKADDINNSYIWLGAGSENNNLHRINRSLIADMCDVIIPGHGPMFSVTAEMREKLKSQIDIL